MLLMVDERADTPIDELWEVISKRNGITKSEFISLLTKMNEKGYIGFEYDNDGSIKGVFLASRGDLAFENYYMFKEELKRIEYDSLRKELGD